MEFEVASVTVMAVYKDRSMHLGGSERSGTPLVRGELCGGNKRMLTGSRV